MTITKLQAQRLLSKDTELARQAVARHITAPLTPKQHHALVSFVFNVGEGQFARSSVVRYLNKGYLTEAAEALLNYVHDSQGRRLRGLEKRRLIEAAMLLGV